MAALEIRHLCRYACQAQQGRLPRSATARFTSGRGRTRETAKSGPLRTPRSATGSSQSVSKLLAASQLAISSRLSRSLSADQLIKAYHGPRLEPTPFADDQPSDREIALVGIDKAKAL